MYSSLRAHFLYFFLFHANIHIRDSLLKSTKVDTLTQFKAHLARAAVFPAGYELRAFSSLNTPCISHSSRRFRYLFLFRLVSNEREKKVVRSLEPYVIKKGSQLYRSRYFEWRLPSPPISSGPRAAKTSNLIATWSRMQISFVDLEVLLLLEWELQLMQREEWINYCEIWEKSAESFGSW